MIPMMMTVSMAMIGAMIKQYDYTDLTSEYRLFFSMTMVIIIIIIIIADDNADDGDDSNEKTHSSVCFLLFFSPRMMVFPCFSLFLGVGAAV